MESSFPRGKNILTRLKIKTRNEEMKAFPIFVCKFLREKLR